MIKNTHVSIANSETHNHIAVIFSHPKTSFITVLAVVVANLLLQRLFDWWPAFVSSVLMFSVLALAMPIVAALLYRKTLSLAPPLLAIIDMPGEQTTLWFDKQLITVFGSVWVYVVSVMLAVTGSVTMHIAWIPWSGVVRVIFFVFSSVLFAATGAVAWSFLGLLIFLIRLGNLQIKGALFEWPEKEIRHLNRVFLEMFAAGVFLYFGAVVAVWLSPGGLFFLLEGPVSNLWVFPVAGMVIAFFLTYQYCIHRIMQRSKQRRLDELNEVLRNKFEDWRKNPSIEDAKVVTELMDWRHRISKELDWPLDFKSTLSILGGLLLPTIKTIADLIIQ